MIYLSLYKILYSKWKRGGNTMEQEYRPMNENISRSKCITSECTGNVEQKAADKCVHEYIKPPVEVRYKEELEALKGTDTGNKPENWQMSPKAVRIGTTIMAKRPQAKPML